MTLAANVKLFCTFDDPLLTDARAGAPLDVTGDPVTLAPGFYGTAARLTPGSYLSAATGLSLTNAFSIGFWLRSTRPGVALNNAGLVVPLRMSLMGISGFSYNSGTGATSLSSPKVVLWEECQPSGFNAVSCSVFGATTATVTSGSYAPGQWQHLWVVYDGPGGKLKVYLNGSAVFFPSGGAVPASLNASSAKFEVNRGVHGASFETARNRFDLDDLLVLDTAVDDTATIGRAVTLGASHLAETSLADVRESYVGAFYDDPATVQTTAATTDGSDLFSCRSDGRLMRGRRAAWRCRRAWGTDAERAALAARYGNRVAFADGVLTPTTAIRA